jgi:hypothetical protein
MIKRILLLLVLSLSLWSESPAGMGTGVIDRSVQGPDVRVTKDHSPPSEIQLAAAADLSQDFEPYYTPPKPSANPPVEQKAFPSGRILVSVIKTTHGLIEIHGSERIVKYDVYTLTRPSRLVIEIKNAVSRDGDITIPINKFGISNARFENTPKFLRIIFDASQGRILPYKIEESNPSLNIIGTTPMR